MSSQLIDDIELRTERDVEVPNRPRRSRNLSVWLAIAAALVVALAAIVVVAQPQGGDSPNGVESSSPVEPTAAEAALADELVAGPLALVESTPLDITYQVSDLDFEVTDDEGNVLRPAELVDKGSYHFVRNADGTWVDQQLTPAQMMAPDGTLSDDPAGLFEITFDGTAKVIKQDGETVLTTEADHTAAPEPSDTPRNPHPRFELSAYGASFLVDLEQGYNDGATDRSSEPVSKASEISCLTGTCYSISFERPVSETFFDSLNRDGAVIERGEIVFDPDTNLALEYRTFINNVLVHEFVVTEVISADKAA